MVDHGNGYKYVRQCIRWQQVQVSVLKFTNLKKKRFEFFIET